MPTYEYECRSCGNRVDVIHPMSESGPETCEICGGPMRRVVHAAGIIFKGSGFYKTDSRRDTGSKSAGAASTSTGSETAGTPATDAPAKAAETSTGKTTTPDPG